MSPAHGAQTCPRCTISNIAGLQPLNDAISHFRLKVVCAEELEQEGLLSPSQEMGQRGPEGIH